MGVKELRFVTDSSLLPVEDMCPSAQVFDDLEAGLQGADVVVALRFQKERMHTDDIAHVDPIAAAFQLNPATFSYANPNAILLHPGPVNIGLELSAAMLSHPASQISQQVANGVWVRAAIISHIHAKTM